MDEFSHNQKIFDYLKTCVESKRLSHAYSFIGCEESAKDEMAEKFALKIIGTEKNNHPDIKIVEAEKNVITISQIRKAKKWLSMTPISSLSKTVIIKSAQKMNDEAQNAFLKILEEPAENTYVILIFGHRKQMLETIYSRTVPIHLGKIKNAKIEIDKNDELNLFQAIANEVSESERMRIWMEKGLKKEEIENWIKQCAILLRKRMINKTDVKTAKILQNIISDRKTAINQSWKLSAENLILSL